MRIISIILLVLYIFMFEFVYAGGSDDKITAICNKFCLAPVEFSYKKTDYSAKLTQSLRELKTEELLNSLGNNAYSIDQIPEALKYLGDRKSVV